MEKVSHHTRKHEARRGHRFHGWIKEWDDSGPRHLSWGRIVMHVYVIL
jgi:hypothetical protein